MVKTPVWPWRHRHGQPTAPHPQDKSCRDALRRTKGERIMAAFLTDRLQRGGLQGLPKLLQKTAQVEPVADGMMDLHGNGQFVSSAGFHVFPHGKNGEQIFISLL